MPYTLVLPCLTILRTFKHTMPRYGSWTIQRSSFGHAGLKTRPSSRTLLFNALHLRSHGAGRSPADMIQHCPDLRNQHPPVSTDAREDARYLVSAGICSDGKGVADRSFHCQCAASTLSCPSITMAYLAFGNFYMKRRGSCYCQGFLFPCILQSGFLTALIYATRASFHLYCVDDSTGCFSFPILSLCIPNGLRRRPSSPHSVSKECSLCPLLKINGTV